MPILPEDLLVVNDLLEDGVPKINKAINNAYYAMQPVTKGRIADNVVNYEKRYIPEVQLINQNAIEVNYKTRTITVGKGCFVSTEKYIFNIAPNQAITVPFPENDSVLYLLLYNYKTGTVYCKPFNEASDYDLSIISLYQKKIYGQSVQNVSYISENDNYDYLTEHRIRVFKQNIVADTIDYTRLNLFEATIISKDAVVLDQTNKKLLIKPSAYATMGSDIFNLNQTTQSLSLDLPQDNRLYAVVFDISMSPVKISIELYSDKEKFTNKRLLFYLYNNLAFGKNSSSLKIINGMQIDEFLSIVEKINKHLNNPFVQTVIYLIGDSITAGMGGTGYDTTGPNKGPFMFKDTDGVDCYENNPNAYCWANTFKKFIELKYNRKVIVSPEDTHITWIGPKQFVYAGTCKNRYYVSTVGLGNEIQFRFYGTEFKLFMLKDNGGGIFDLYVDNVKKGTYDMYSAETVYSHEIVVSGLVEGNHDVRIVQATTSNPSSISNRIKVEGVELTKNVVVKNRGVSGKDGRWIYLNKEKLVEEPNSLVILQIGTNDRIKNRQVSAEGAVGFQRAFIEFCKTKNIDVILSVANPVAYDNQESGDYNFGMPEVRNAISALAKEYKTDFVDNYDAFLRHCEIHGITIDSLLNDKLHPKDNGYQLMFRNIIRSLGLPLLIDEYEVDKLPNS